jgi:hypothetical protein
MIHSSKVTGAKLPFPSEALPSLSEVSDLYFLRYFGYLIITKNIRGSEFCQPFDCPRLKVWAYSWLVLSLPKEPGGFIRRLIMRGSAPPNGSRFIPIPRKRVIPQAESAGKLVH